MIGIGSARPLDGRPTRADGAVRAAIIARTCADAEGDPKYASKNAHPPEQTRHLEKTSLAGTYPGQARFRCDAVPLALPAPCLPPRLPAGELPRPLHHRTHPPGVRRGGRRL